MAPIGKSDSIESSTLRIIRMVTVASSWHVTLLTKFLAAARDTTPDFVNVTLALARYVFPSEVISVNGKESFVPAAYQRDLTDLVLIVSDLK
jgi:hypothetical protein